MGNRKTIVIAGVCLLACAGLVAHLAVRNGALRAEVARLQAALRAREARRPRLELPSSRPPRTAPRVRTAERIMPAAGTQPAAPSGERISDEAVDKAVAARIAALKKDAEEARERRREAIAALTPEQKQEQRDAFLERMRERSQQRMRAFVTKARLDAGQTVAFENTVAALDATLRETADAWAERIRKTGTFSRDAQIRFVSEVGTVICAGYGQMDATLPASWRTEDGDVNLMEIVGPEALSSMVEALTESGLEEGLQTIGQVMGGPAEAPEGLEGLESPGVGGGPGMGGPGGMGGGPGGGPAVR